MSKGNLEKDPNKLYWDEENQVYMQYSPISDKFLANRVSLWDIDKEEYNPNNLPRYSVESANKSSDTFDKQETDKNNNQYVLCSNSTDTTSKLFPGYDNVLKNSILTEKENMNNSQGPVIKKYEPLDKRIPKQYSTGLNPNQSNKVPQNILGNKGYGIMQNDYFENIDTLALANKSPYLNKITNFNNSNNIYKETWNSIADASNKMVANIYGTKVFNTIKPKSINYNYNKNLSNNANTDRVNRTINIKEKDPLAGDLIEEWIHMAQNDFYKGNLNEYPGLNIEAEAKVIADFIHLKNLKANTFDNMTEIPGVRIFMGANDEDGKLNLEYLDMLDNVINNGYFTSSDLERYYKVGEAMSPEKFSKSKRSFERKPPLFLFKIIDELKH